MDTMKSKATHALRGLLGLALGLALMTVSVIAQQLSPSPKSSADAKTPKSSAVANAPDPDPQVGEDVGDYTIISSMEFGYGGLGVALDLDKYKSVLNYKADTRGFDSNFLMR